MIVSLGGSTVGSQAFDAEPLHRPVVTSVARLTTPSMNTSNLGRLGLFM